MNTNQAAPKRPALRYYGGGWTRAPWTIAHIPEHDNYVEPCFGAGSILLRKPPAALETINDIDGRTVNFFRVLREQPEQLLRLINLTPWADEEVGNCLPVADDPVEDARRFFMVCWGTIQGGPTGQGGSFSFRWQKSAFNRFVSPPLDAVKREDLLDTAARLKTVQILNRDALEVIEKFLRQDAVIYFDPPYLAETRARKRGYNHEPSPAWHRLAAMMLREARGPVLVAGYPSRLYERIYEEYGFVRVERRQSTNGKTKATECLWLSPLTVERLQRDEDAKKAAAQVKVTQRRKELPLLADVWGG